MMTEKYFICRNPRGSHSHTRREKGGCLRLKKISAWDAEELMPVI